MARNNGRHRISRRTKIATGAIGLAMAVGALVVTTTAGNPGDANADAADKSFFVDITKVKPNVKKARQQGNASRGTFTVNCGRNENGHFNPDNFIAQPGVKNGAQHLHDYVGNLSTNADSNNKSLVKAGTTCRNGDKSAYFWPVIRIDTGDEEEAKKDNPPAEPQKQQRDQQAAQDKQDKAQPQVDCPDVASQLPAEIPDNSQQAVEDSLKKVDEATDAANTKLPAAKNPDQDVAAPLADQRKQELDKISQTLAQAGQPADLSQLAQCKVKAPNGTGGQDNGGSANNVPEPGTDTKPKPPESNDNELPGNDGVIQRPVRAQLTFTGSEVGKVTAMPKFLRILYGDAKESQNGPKNAKDSWTCEGFENRVLMDKYPICPVGKKVKRIHEFPSCWDGKNIDSTNHRDHIVFPDANGRCGKGFKAVPRLVVTLTYDIPHDIQVKGQYKVDAFPFEKHNPKSDHDDFANVMTQCIMNRVVNCINKGRSCNE
ncbi:DUF1996 domain-containing protein [Actinocrispum wychmicini]|uniref:Uncharacterized protein DUF1996 n=1 Tax=Actinocrispum wychmicini TaxID=1213861 RepID=A0A4R2JDW8_9PSEU|nr:DUF1996 domain-containing protein [Actinocrispum wychmicini]TCO56727.1 uncharacterized protein DUF1996 [Actinocrispum wychmicini]